MNQSSFKEQLTTENIRSLPCRRGTFEVSYILDVYIRHRHHQRKYQTFPCMSISQYGGVSNAITDSSVLLNPSGAQNDSCHGISDRCIYAKSNA